MRAALLSAGAALCAAADSTLVITAGTQTGFFQTRTDIGSMNPHDYRPNEFVTNDFVFEGLVAWDGEHTAGVDGIAGNEDDFVKPSLAASWTTNLADVLTGGSSTPYEITFTLRSGVTFHDGEPWNAAAAKVNFDQIMGGEGLVPGGDKWLKGLHDWMGFTQVLDTWTVVDAMTFKLTFTTYYEAALRELSFIRPFRMISPKALPSLANNEVSHIKFRKGKPRVFGGSPWGCQGTYAEKDTDGNPTGNNLPCVKEGVIMRGVKAPLGTGPYKVIDKLLTTATGTTRRLPAAEFNASCYQDDACKYGDGEWVSEVLFQKVPGHWRNPIYDNIIMRSYNTVQDVKTALKNDTLDVAYGVNVLSQSAFVSIATAEEGSNLVAHKSASDINTRLIVLNSGGRLNTPDLRKLVMGVLAAAKQSLLDGELSEEQPMETLFDPKAPHCGVLSTLSSLKDLAATKSASVTAASLTQPLRFIYIKDVPHQQMIASWVISTLYTAGINVVPMPVNKKTYNSRHCDYLGDPNGTFPYWYSYTYGDPSDNYHSWDISYSETWGPPYDPTSKLWDMTHGKESGWCSNEADAPAVTNMESMDLTTFVSKVRSLSTTIGQTAREAAYSELLTTLHDEAIFFPLTAKLQTAVTNTRVSGFKFGFMEFDLPLTNLKPAPPATPALTWQQTATAAGWTKPCNGRRQLDETERRDDDITQQVKEWKMKMVELEAKHRALGTDPSQEIVHEAKLYTMKAAVSDRAKAMQL